MELKQFNNDVIKEKVMHELDYIQNAYNGDEVENLECYGLIASVDLTIHYYQVQDDTIFTGGDGDFNEDELECKDRPELGWETKLIPVFTNACENTVNADWTCDDVEEYRLLMREKIGEEATVELARRRERDVINHQKLKVSNKIQTSDETDDHQSSKRKPDDDQSQPSKVMKREEKN